MTCGGEFAAAGGVKEAAEEENVMRWRWRWEAVDWGGIYRGVGEEDSCRVAEEPWLWLSGLERRKKKAKRERGSVTGWRVAGSS